MRNAFFISLFFVCCLTGFGQSPYEIQWKKELPYIGTAAVSLGIGAYLSDRTPLFMPDELLTLDPDDINPLDRIATGYFSESSDKLSDVFWIGSHSAPLFFLVGQESRKHFGHIIVLYGESAFICAGLTAMTKSLFRRPRPFVFNMEVLEETKLTRTAKTSFVSGHTSMTAVNSFFAAKVFSDFYPDSKWKPVVWSVAATIPALTGFLRVSAGKHYPTDVIAGYAMGATIGILVPHLHRNKNLENLGLRLDAGPNHARLTWNFNR